MSKRTQEEGGAPEPKRLRESPDADEADCAEPEDTPNVTLIGLIDDEEATTKDSAPAPEPVNCEEVISEDCTPAPAPIQDANLEPDPVSVEELTTLSHDANTFHVPEPFRCVLDFIMEGDRHDTHIDGVIVYHFFYLEDRVVGFFPDARRPLVEPEERVNVRKNLRQCNVLIRQGVPFTDLFKLSLDEIRKVPSGTPTITHTSVREHSEDCFSSQGTSDVELHRPFCMHFIVTFDQTYNLYMCKDLPNTLALLRDIRGMTEYGQVHPEDNHKVLRVIAHFELYRKAILVFGMPNTILELSVKILKSIFEQRFTPYECLVYFVRNERLAFNTFVENFQIDYGEKLLSVYGGDTKDLNVELANWCAYLRTGNYFTIMTDTPFYADVCSHMTSTDFVVRRLDNAHVMLQNPEALGEVSDGCQFLQDVSDHLPWHPPVLANPKKRATSIEMQNFAPSWWQMDQFEANSFYKFVAGSKRLHKMQSDCMFFWNNPSRIGNDTQVKKGITGGVPDLKKFRINCQKKAIGSSHRVDFDIFKDSGQVLNVVLFMRRRILPFECAAECISAKMEKSEKMRTRIIDKYQSLFNFKSKRDIKKIQGLEINVVVVFDNVSQMSMHINKPSGKYPYMSRVESIARVGCGNLLYNLYNPRLYHTYEQEFKDKFMLKN